MLEQLLARLFGPSDTASPLPTNEHDPAPSVVTGDRTHELVARITHSEAINLIHAGLGDYSGYVREAAVRRAAELGMTTLLPGVAERLNDWVTQVRDAARTAVLALLDKLDPGANIDLALQLLVQVQHLREARRADHADWVAEFEAHFVERLGGQRIVAAIGSAQSRVALACFTLALHHSLASPADLCRRAMSNKHHFALVQKAIARVRVLPELDRAILYRQALESRVGMARAEALRGLLAAAVD